MYGKIVNMTPFAKPIILSVLAFIVASGGVYGGYRVLRDDGNYGADFESRVHNVKYVVDGDTFVVEGFDADDDIVNEVRVRLLGVNAPELGTCYGEESKKALSRMLLGKKVYLEKDRSGDDGYGRLLRYVLVRSAHPEVDDVFVVTELARIGAVRAQYVPPNKRYAQQIAAAEQEAIDARRGLWGNCDYVSQRETRREDRQVASETFSKECVIKGNTGRWGKTYLLPWCPNYKRSKIDIERGERWFCSEKEARDAGWKRSKGCENVRKR